MRAIRLAEEESFPLHVTTAISSNSCLGEGKRCPTSRGEDWRLHALRLVAIIVGWHGLSALTVDTVMRDGAFTRDENHGDSTLRYDTVVQDGEEHDSNTIHTENENYRPRAVLLIAQWSRKQDRPFQRSRLNPSSADRP